MVIFTTLVIVIAISLCYKLWIRLYGGRLDLPGPSILDVLWISTPNKTHHYLTRWAVKYGNLSQIRCPGMNIVLVSGYEAIHEALIVKSNDFSGRLDSFWMRAALGGDEGLISGQPTNKWRSIRKLSSMHLKQYGEGMQRLQKIFTEQSDILIRDLENTNGEEFNCEESLFSAAFGSICVLLFGKRLSKNERVYENLIKYQQLATETSLDSKIFFLDLIPYLRNSNMHIAKKMREMVSTIDDIWTDILVMAPSLSDCSLIRVMLEKDGEYDVNTIKYTVLNLMFAGVLTTTQSLYALLNIVLHHPEVKRKIESEIFSVLRSNRSPALSLMPYTHAAILELLRYQSLIPFGVARQTTKNTTLCGHPLPEGTILLTNYWGVHHEETFWGDPWVFRPERFMNEIGDALVLADHPNRRQLFAFGAGPRICLGENMAKARLFIWFVSIMQRFDIQLGDVDVTCDVSKYDFSGVVKQPTYEAKFIKRVSS